MAVPRCLKPVFLALAAVLTITAVTHGQGVAEGQPSKVIPPSQNDRWMTEMAALYPSYGKLTLTQVIFPGSHDSATWHLFNALGPDGRDMLNGSIPEANGPAATSVVEALYQRWNQVRDVWQEHVNASVGGPLPANLYDRIAAWGRAQGEDITGQLEGGVRYFDLRLCSPQPGEVLQQIRLCHFLYGPTLDDVLSQVNTFLAKPGREKEIVILDFNMFSGFDAAMHMKAQQNILNGLGCGQSVLAETCRMEVRDSSKGAQVTLQTLWNNRKNVIALYPDAVYGPVFWGNSLSGTWPNQTTLDDNLRRIVKNLDCRCGYSTDVLHGPAATSTQFFQLGMQITPDSGSEVVKELHLRPTGQVPGRGLEDVASQSNPATIRAIMSEGHVSLNIPLVDFTVQSGLVEAVKNLTIAKLDGARIRRGTLTQDQVDTMKLIPSLPPLPRAFLSRTDTVDSHAASVRTSWNGTYFGYPSRIVKDDAFILPGVPSWAHFDSRLFGGTTGVSAIADDYLKTDRIWGNGDNLAVNVGPSLLFGLTYPASYAAAYGGLYVTWSDGEQAWFRASGNGTTFFAQHFLANADSTPVLATHRGVLYAAWVNQGFLHYGKINNDDTVLELGYFSVNAVGRPALTGFKDELVFAWTMSNHNIVAMRINPAVNPTAGTAIAVLPYKSDATPSLAVFKGSVVLAFTGQNANQFTLLSKDGVEFGEQVWQGPPAPTSLAGPTLHAWGDPPALVAAARTANGDVYPFGAPTNQDVVVTFTCKAPVAGFYGIVADAIPGYFAGQFLPIETLDVPVSAQGAHSLQASCVDLAGRVGAGRADVTIDRTPPTVAYVGSTPGMPASGWYATDVVSTFSCADPSGLVDASPQSTLTTEGANQFATVTCVDLAGNRASGQSTVSFNIDKSGPTISVISRSPAANANGWNNTDVVVVYDVADSLSGAAGPRTQSQLFTAAAVHAVTVTDIAGNSATYDVVRIDRDPPVYAALAQRRTAANADGWNNTPVLYEYRISDNLSGAPTGFLPIWFEGEGKDQHQPVTVTDFAGNARILDIYDRVKPINIDLTAPALAVPQSFTRIVSGAGPTFAIEYDGVTASDALSGVAGETWCDHPSGSQFPSGVTRVNCAVLDKAGNITWKDFDITVVANHAPAISGVSGAGVEGSPATVTVAAGDPDAAAVLKYSFDCDGNGSFEVGPQAAATASCRYDDNGSRRVNVRVTDEHGATDDEHVDVAVANVAPSASFSNTGSVDEGASFTLTLSGATDPSPADTSAGFQYAFDCGTGYGAFSSSNTATCTAGTRGSVTVRGKVRDKDLGESEGYVATVTVNGVPPVITVPGAITMPAAGPDGAVVTFAASAVDALDGPVDVDCSPKSGSTFRLGTTRVSCWAADKHGTSAEPRFFDVTVVDRTAPVLSVADVVAEATGPNGAPVPFAATAIDLVDSHPSVVCTRNGSSVVPGATFPIGATPVSCTATDASGNSDSAGFTITVRDTIVPVVTFSGNTGSYSTDQLVEIRCAATDGGSGIASTTCADLRGPAYSFAVGNNTFAATATDAAGNVGSGSTSFTVVASPTSLQALVSRFCTKAGVAEGLNAKLAAAAKAPNANARAGQLGAFANQVRAQTGKSLTAADAAVLLQLAAGLN